MSDLLAWLQDSALGHAVRSAGVWSYAVINLVHITGVATLFGSVLLIDLRLLGAWASIPIQHVTTPAVPVAKTGFTVAALSGLCLLATNAVEYTGNPFLPIKFTAIGLGVLNIVVLERTAAWKVHRTRPLTSSERRLLVIAAALSLTCWTIALVAGRMIGYW